MNENRPEDLNSSAAENTADGEEEKGDEYFPSLSLHFDPVDGFLAELHRPG